jgi:prefoldin subunit 4
MELDRRDERPDVRMMAADKDRINRFSRLLSRRGDLSSTLARREKLRQLHEDAADELVLADDDAKLQYNIGDVFIFDDKSEIEARIEETKGELDAEIGDLRAQIEEATSEIQSLKATLYAKFGKSINLEESPDE